MQLVTRLPFLRDYSGYFREFSWEKLVGFLLVTTTLDKVYISVFGCVSNYRGEIRKRHIFRNL